MRGNSRFMNRKVDILRPALEVDVTVIRDRILTDYVVVKANAQCFREPSPNGVVFDAQLGGILVENFTFYFPKDTDVQPMDVLKFTHPVTGVVTYYDVRGREDFSEHTFHVRIAAIKKNYHRGQ
jgi:hypothetical protein